MGIRALERFFFSSLFFVFPLSARFLFKVHGVSFALFSNSPPPFLKDSRAAERRVKGFKGGLAGRVSANHGGFSRRWQLIGVLSRLAAKSQKKLG